MKKIAYFFAIILLATIASCKEDRETTGTITGTITDENNQPVAEVEVSVDVDNFTETDASGKFVFADIPEAKYDILCTKDGYRTKTVTLILHGGNTENVDIEMESFTPNIELTTTEYQAPSSAQGTELFQLLSNTGWTVSSDVSWLSVTPQSGKDNAYLTVSWTQNTTPEHRTGHITVITSIGNINKSLSIVQPGTQPVFEISPLTQSVSFEQGVTSFEVTANVNWSASSNQTWLTCTTAGSNNGIITANFTANPELVERQATITVIGGGITKTLTVTQAQFQVITINEPTEGLQWNIGIEQQIKWTDNFTDNIKIELFKADEFIMEITASAPSNGVYKWIVPSSLDPASDYTVKISNAGIETVTAMSKKFSLNIFLDEGLVAYYPFNGTATDVMGDFDGTVNNASLATDHNGYANSSYTFDGEDDYITLGDVMNSVFSTNTFTMNMWVNVASLTNAAGTNPGAVVSKFSTTGSAMNNAFAIYSNGAFYSSSNTISFEQFPLSSWVMLTILMQDGTVSIYKNGVKITSEIGHDCNSSTYELIFGNNWNLADDFFGKLDDIRIYNRALQDSEIVNLKNLK